MVLKEKEQDELVRALKMFYQEKEQVDKQTLQEMLDKINDVKEFLENLYKSIGGCDECDK